MDRTPFSKPSGKLAPYRDGIQCFIPDVLPVEIKYDLEMAKLLEEATLALGRLDVVAKSSLDWKLFVKPYITKEAVLSSKIEGTRSTLSDLLIAEAREIKGENDRGDLQEVMNYILALNGGIEYIRKSKKIDLELILKLNGFLLQNVRGTNKEVGVLRSRQNWIGPSGPIEYATYVPPPANVLNDLLNNLLDYINTDKSPELVKLALFHYQFEAIHPFVDGNGRVGRLLLILYLMSKQILTAPLLYASEYFEGRRDEYYQLLLKVSAESDYEAWIKFFLKGIAVQAGEASSRAEAILKFIRVRGGAIKKKYHASTFLAFQSLASNPYTTISKTASLAGISYPAAKRAVENLIKEGVIEKIEDKDRIRKQMFVSRQILDFFK